jgi:hypothetical protein
MLSELRIRSMEIEDVMLMLSDELILFWRHPKIGNRKFEIFEIGN